MPKAFGLNGRKAIDMAETIINDMGGVKLSGTSVADCIINYGDRVTINAGDGNDYVVGRGSSS